MTAVVSRRTPALAGGEDVSRGMVTTLRFAAAIAAVLAALLGALFVFDVVEGPAAREALAKMLVVVALFTLAMLAVLFLTGSRGKERP